MHYTHIYLYRYLEIRDHGIGVCLAFRIRQKLHSKIGNQVCTHMGGKSHRSQVPHPKLPTRPLLPTKRALRMDPDYEEPFARALTAPAKLFWQTHSTWMLNNKTQIGVTVQLLQGPLCPSLIWPYNPCIDGSL